MLSLEECSGKKSPADYSGVPGEWVPAGGVALADWTSGAASLGCVVHVESS